MAESSALAFQRSHVSAIVLARAKNLRAAVKKKRVLDEDEFTDVLDGIIRRDFFPDLAVLDAQHALLDALEAGDQAAATAAYKRLVPANAGGSVRAPKRPRHSRSAAAAAFSSRPSPSFFRAWRRARAQRALYRPRIFQRIFQRISRTLSPQLV